ncbi:MAG: hypothetical protein DRG78_09115 [Epsilonproteobacteria bacterium]|nr:MAG: hypothetical protein DRG78_09115 [Campylobacterota bacterium]
MNINTTNNLNPVNELQNSSLDKIATGLAINSAADDASSLSIAVNINAQNSTMHQALANLNSGIAMSNIAQGGLKEQSNILDEINTLTLSAMNGTTSDDGREAIFNEISKLTEQFKNVSDSTNYNGQKLLSGEKEDLAIIVDGEASIEMETEDTMLISKKLEDALIEVKKNPSAIKDLLNVVKQGQEELSQVASNFASSSVQMESSGRSALSAEVSLAKANSNIMGVDYAQEVSNFSKSNLITQMGLLATTQANAVQQRNTHLLT